MAVAESIIEPARKLCSCCLSSRNLENVKNICKYDNIKESYADTIYQLFSINICQRNEPKSFICKRCIVKLNDVLQFKNLIQTSQTILSQNLIESLVENKRTVQNDDKIIIICLEDNDEKVDCKVLDKDVLQEFPQVEQNSGKVAEEPRPYKLDLETLKCKICDRKFYNIKTLDSHMNIHYPNYVCTRCGKGYATDKRLKSHISSHAIGNFQCSKCELIFPTQSKLNMHRQKRHAPEGKFRCPQCKIRFKSYEMRLKHLHEVHGCKKVTYTCNECSSVFNTSSRLHFHVRKNHLKLKKYFCDYCTQGFITKQILTNHMVKHSGVKRYTCNVCKKKYARKHTLVTHMIIHSDEKKFKCSFCMKKFSQRCSLKIHSKSHLGLTQTMASCPPDRK